MKNALAFATGVVVGVASILTLAVLDDEKPEWHIGETIEEGMVKVVKLFGKEI